MDTEFDTRLRDAQLIEAIIDECEISRTEWDAMTDLEWRKQQVCFVAPPFCLF